MAEIWFYHLERVTPEALLPTLLARGLERGLRMCVETIDATRIKAMSAALWGQEDISFIPHGTEADADAAEQPILLCASAANPNAAPMRFYVDGATPQALDGLSRASILFAAADAMAVETARNLWRSFKAQGHAIRYWKQDEAGRWQDMTAATSTAA